MSTAVAVSDVSKSFRLSHQKYSSLKERLIHFGHVPFERFDALRGVSLEITQGDTWGLLGHNGSGKSTLLKCIAGILQPTTGRIEVRGRLAALLELGAGFHPDLTGRENVFLNGSLLGLSRRDIERRFDEIIAFSELERFVDQQVKFFSSGMYVRLGFAVAINADPDILLVDEVLAVGDESFQRKCLDRVRQFQRDGKTIIVVTHSPDLVRQICQKAAVLDHGELVAMGTPSEAIRSFREHLLLKGDRADLAESLAAALDDGAGGDPSLSAEGAGHSGRGLRPEDKRNYQVEILGVDMVYAGAAERPYILPGEPLTIRVRYRAKQPIADPNFGYAIHDLDGNLLSGSNTRILGMELGTIHGDGEVTFAFEDVPLLDGTYMVTIAITSREEHTVYDWHEQRYQFEVLNPGTGQGMVHLPVSVQLRS